MSSIEGVLGAVKTITFDCYGTLIDWRKGLTEVFAELFGTELGARSDEVFRTYVSAEAAIESGPYRSYREVLSAVTERVAEKLGFDLAPERAGLLAERLPDWTPFPDTNEALSRLKERYQLGVLSNIDRDLFAGTARCFDVAFDFVVTAEDVGAYKPAHDHFERLVASHAPTSSLLHVAQSLFHDGIPTMELGLAFVWINRYGESNPTRVEPVATVPDLKSLAQIACPP
ncbi:MAG: HAD-IA family hydrolase [Phycisphaerae bacterium]